MRSAVSHHRGADEIAKAGICPQLNQMPTVG